MNKEEVNKAQLQLISGYIGRIEKTCGFINL